MRKWPFWSVMCLTSLVNGLLFYQQSRLVMEGGIQGADNQASLLFIPLFWIMAAIVLAALNLYTLAYSRNVSSTKRLHPLEVFDFSSLDKREIVERTLFLAAVCLLMLFGYFLFNTGVWSAGYALSGGLLLIFLYAWQKAGAQGVCR